MHINHDANNGPDRVPNGAVITLNNTAPVWVCFSATVKTRQQQRDHGAVNLGAGHNVIAADYTGGTAGRFGTLTLGAAAGSVIGRSNNSTTLVVGRNLGSVAYGSVAIASTGGASRLPTPPPD